MSSLLPCLGPRGSKTNPQCILVELHYTKTTGVLHWMGGVGTEGGVKGKGVAMETGCSLSLFLCHEDTQVHTRNTRTHPTPPSSTDKWKAGSVFALNRPTNLWAGLAPPDPPITPSLYSHQPLTADKDSSRPEQSSPDNKDEQTWETRIHLD